MNWIVRPARSSDEHEVIEAIRSLCAEIRGNPELKLPLTAAQVFKKIISNTIPGAVIIAETTDRDSLDVHLFLSKK